MVDTVVYLPSPLLSFKGYVVPIDGTAPLDALTIPLTFISGVFIPLHFFCYQANQVYNDTVNLTFNNAAGGGGVTLGSIAMSLSNMNSTVKYQLTAAKTNISGGQPYLTSADSLYVRLTVGMAVPVAGTTIKFGFAGFML